MRRRECAAAAVAARIPLRTDERRDVEGRPSVSVMHQDALLAHERRPAFDPAELQALAGRLDFQLGAGHQVEPVQERLRDDDSPGRIDGNDHGMMVFLMDVRVNRASGGC